MGYKTYRKEEDLALRKILECTASYTGKEFFHALVKNLAEVLGTKGAMVTEFIPEEKKAHVLAFWIGNDFVDGYEYGIEGTPCERVFEKRRLYHVPKNLLKIFPDDADLKSFSASSYLGMPLLDLDGTILGNLAVLDTRPMPEVARNVTL
ncbi:MAG: GAF domain-containing protein, partial [Candidatus Halalkalibacterium sp. M3_1C_030]